MKSIIFIFIFLISVFADNIQIPQIKTTTLNAEDVAKNGWKVAEPPLKKFIIKDGNVFINKFLQEVKSPFQPSKIKGDVPKALLIHKHYHYALSYLKYLENQNQTKKSLKIYFAIFKGLHKLNLDNFAILSAMYKVTVEKIAINSLNNSLENNIYSASQKAKIQSVLKKYLLLDEKLFYNALEADRKKLADTCGSQLASIGLDNKMFSASNFIKIRDTNEKELYKKICFRLNSKLKNYNKKLGNITSEIEKNNLEKYMKKSEVDFYNNIYSLKEKSFKELKKLEENPNNFINSIAGILFYVSYMKNGYLQLETIKRVEENKKLLSRFWLFSPPNKYEETNNLPYRENYRSRQPLYCRRIKEIK